MPRFDQHFLRTEGYARRIAAAVSPLSDETILEVGPGTGALTRYLLQKGHPYIGIEIDKSCINQLALLEGPAPIRWICQDFLRVELPQQPLYFVSNLPYSITGPTLFRILEHRFWIREGVIMLQAEVAQRLYASPNSSAYGRVSVLFQSVYETRRLFQVPKGAFSPPPRVESEVVKFTRKAKIPLEAWESFAEVVRQAFRQPRQTLARNLRSACLPCPAHQATRRPHQLSVEEYIALWQIAIQKGEIPTSKTA
ncbi:MAG: 16S rRNA (adenine(1518)-N(6)/adenine(1519)-N(6))-dimethyltransferase RsmA [Bacteroidia bacterium]|nr:16S rRNA (adenine(1518)-N(6)/adenine(1519)-N(6))-dimethyltransferase RsmA [Bacteroidia bacterium]MDW8014671.1 16S rRNA (adenine(1518)-N(6)/adenine(1519)-N(6))-dimethyltransferase RsmA [Bacteroidia bacterium]